MTFSFLDKKSIDDLKDLVIKMSDWLIVFDDNQIKNMDIVLDFD